MMDNIKKIIIRLKTLLIRYKRITLVVILLLICLMCLIPYTFAVLQPIKSVEIFSEKLSYQNKESGAWKVTKSAKWTKQGDAEITIDVDSILKAKNSSDVLLVLDVSGSMNGEKIRHVKENTINLINNLLDNGNNRVGVIIFESSSEIISDFTDDKNLLVERVNSLSLGGTTNYYQALLNVDEILKGYSKEAGRECVVLFLTDGYPNVDTPSEVGEFNYLKMQYPYITINAIQYEMGVQVLNEVKRISDNQFIAGTDTLNDVLFDASIVPIAFDNFNITDYIDTNYFYIEDEKSISINQGKIEFDKNSQKVQWTLGNYKSGSKATMTIKAKLKENITDSDNIYPSNEKIEITSKIEETEEDITSKRTPVLADNYRVVYDGNVPGGCVNLTIPETQNHHVFETVLISDEVPVCNGYQFKGWKIATEGAEMINDDYFIMPESDVKIKGVWSKLDIKKSMDGTIKESLTMYKQVQQDFNDPNKYVRKYTGDTSTFNGNEDVYYYYGAAANNNVIFANYCWKIVRTTDTGGVKLLYNGVPSPNLKCNNTKNDSQLTAKDMNLSTNSVEFNSISSLAGSGYMYNSANGYPYNSSSSSFLNILDESVMYETSNYYYADSFSFVDGIYTLNNPKKYVWSENFENLEGMYTFRSTSSSSNSSQIYYVAKAAANRMYYLSFNRGEGFEDSKDSISFSKTIEKLDDGNYSLVDPFTISKIDWGDSSIVNYYTCGTNSDICSSEELMYSVWNTPTLMYYVKLNNVKYGKSFNWDGERYTLNETIDIWNPYVSGVLDSHHYTCFNYEGECSQLAYVFRVRGISYHYIILADGKSISDALDEMLYRDGVNNESSTIKKVIDYWYFNNLVNYTSYLEDTVWCNDRSLINGDISGWNPNGGQNSRNLEFKSYRNTVDLTCMNRNDRFTVSSEKGNGDLTYPVGLITRQEQSLAFVSNESPLSSGNVYRGISPMFVFTYLTVSSYVVENGNSDTWYSNDTKLGVRPSISLRKGIEYTSGDGSVDSPYIILTD